MIGLATLAGARIPHGLNPIEWVVGADPSNLATLIVPAHAANDYIVAWGKSPGNTTVPATPAGWTSLLYSGSRAVMNQIRFYGIRDTANSIATLARPGGTADVGFAIYRNVSGAGAATVTADTLGPTSKATPSLGTLSAGSWVLAGCDINQGSALTAPAGVSVRMSRAIALGGGTGIAFDDNAVVVSYAGGAVTTWSTGAIAQTFAIELLNG